MDSCMATERRFIKVIDYETSIKCPVGNNKAHPMWLGNKVVLAGVKAIYPGRDELPVNVIEDRPITTTSSDETTLLVGHNVKFDALYTYRGTNTVLPTLWDTQLAEYLLTGQQEKYASLDSLIVKYVGAASVKDSRIKDYWDKGIDTEDIPRSELEPYLINDVACTTTIFKAQWAECERRGILPWVLTQMDALRATTCMSLAGMYVNWGYVNSQQNVYDGERKLFIESAQKLLGDFQWSSNKDLSLYFFGGKVKKTRSIEIGTYKNGKPKFKKEEYEEEVKGKLPWLPSAAPGASGYYSVDEAQLEAITKSILAPKDAIEVATFVLAARSSSKIADTYYGGLQQLRFPNNCIYPNLNHCQTATGRLSSSQPNLQNQTTDGDVKRSFISRWGKAGVILELDYSQLEMVWLACLSNDKQLIDDINSGRDMHTELFVSMYHRLPTKDERKQFKRRSFALVYGAGAKGIAEQTGIDITEAKLFINTFYTRYSGVKSWHNSLQNEAEKYSEVFYKISETGPHRRYVMRMPWGRQYVFTTYHNAWSATPSFSPTELKNYPVQGSATGDMVPMMVGILQRKLEEAGHWERQDALLINTVHDSVLLDVKKEVLYNVAKLCKETLENAPLYLKQHLNITFPCRLSVGVEAGPNWQDIEPISV